MSRDTIVLGAGMVGVCVAYHLARRGHTVTLVDRRAPGQETSFGNGGIIQREAVAPYAFPHDLKALLRILSNRSVDIRYRWRGLQAAAGPLLSYWLNSFPRRYARIVPEYASLIGLATESHAVMIQAAGAQSLVRHNGWLEVYRTSRALEVRAKEAQIAASRYGVRYETLDRVALERAQPQLAPSALGAIWWRNSWSVTSPGDLVQAYARAFEAQGGRLLQAEVESITAARGDWRVAAGEVTMEAPDVVLALGPWAGNWLSRLQCRLPLFTKRGYHMHYAARENAVLHHCMLDAEVGYLLAPMRAGIRLTTGAELARPGAPSDYGQLEAAQAVARALFPLGERIDATPWVGARPCTPDMKPVIGAAPGHRGLWLALGHGHQGFTLGPATGGLLAQMMDNEPTTIDMTPFRADRF